MTPVLPAFAGCARACTTLLPVAADGQTASGKCPDSALMHASAYRANSDRNLCACKCWRSLHGLHLCARGAGSAAVRSAWRVSEAGRWGMPAAVQAPMDEPSIYWKTLYHIP